MKQFENEVREKWGNTHAFKEYAEKTQGYSEEKFNTMGEGLENILKEFADCMNSGVDYASAETQAKVQKLQDYITENFYNCTNEILAGLGQMYVSDDRFKNNIDKHSAGTAEFVSKAIRFYCR